MNSHILHRQIHSRLAVAVKGDGAYLIDSSGKRYLDASCGAAVSCLGHSHPRVTEAIKAQVDKLAFAHSAFFTNEPAEELANLISNRAPGDLNHAYFVSGGSEAIESALKLARQYFVERGEMQRGRFIARRQSYHGNTLGALSIGGNLWRRRDFAPLLTECSHISPCYPYRDRDESETLEQYGRRVADELEEEILKQGAENVIGFVAETVGGATAGVLTPVPGYFKRIREICDQYGILLILDEVMCGMGRTGSLFACEQEEIVPDIVAVAKGLGGGYQPIGAMLLSDRLFAQLEDGSGALKGGHTYMAHATACAAALAVQKVIEENGLLENVRRRGEQLLEAMQERFGSHANIGDIRGRGLFWGLELVADRDSKQPFDASLGLHEKIRCAALDQGLICYPGQGTIDGINGTHVMLAPPFIVEDSHIHEIVDKLDTALDVAIKG